MENSQRNNQQDLADYYLYIIKDGGKIDFQGKLMDINLKMQDYTNEN